MNQTSRPRLWTFLRQLGIVLKVPVLLVLVLDVLARKLFLGALGVRIVWVTFSPVVVMASLHGGWPTGLLTRVAPTLTRPLTRTLERFADQFRYTLILQALRPFPEGEENAGALS